MTEVKATRPFQHSEWGSKETGDKFDYPVTEDPAGLLGAGFVERVEKPSPPSPPPPPGKPS